DVRVVERGEKARLAEQLAEIEILLVRNLERDLLVDPGVFREVDRPEASAAQSPQDLVLSDDLPAEEHLRRSIAAHGRLTAGPDGNGRGQTARTRTIETQDRGNEAHTPAGRAAAGCAGRNTGHEERRQTQALWTSRARVFAVLRARCRREAAARDPLE